MHHFIHTLCFSRNRVKLSQIEWYRVKTSQIDWNLCQSGVKGESNQSQIRGKLKPYCRTIELNWVESKHFLLVYFVRMFEYSMHKSHLLERHTATITHLLHFIGRVLNFFFMTYYPDDVCTCRNSFDISCPNHKALTSHSTAI